MNLDLKKAQDEPKFFQVLRKEGRYSLLMEYKQALEESSIPYDYILSDTGILEQSQLIGLGKIPRLNHYPHRYLVDDIEWEAWEADKYAYKKELYDMPNSGYWGKHRAVWYFVFPTDSVEPMSEQYVPDVDLGEEYIEEEYEEEQPQSSPEAYIVGEGYIDGPYDWYIRARSEDALTRARGFIGEVAVW